jgi:hypothetical protein
MLLLQLSDERHQSANRSCPRQCVNDVFQNVTLRKRPDQIRLVGATYCNMHTWASLAQVCMLRMLPKTPIYAVFSQLTLCKLTNVWRPGQQQLQIKVYSAHQSPRRHLCLLHKTLIHASRAWKQLAERPVPM